VAKLNRTHAADLHGVARLAFEATAGLVDVVERMHHTIQRRPWPLGKPAAGSTRGITGFVYRTVRGSVHLIGRGIDASLAPVVELMPEGAAGPRRDALLAAINGVYGDYLARTSNPLAIPMSVRYRGQPVDVADPGGSLRAAGGPAPAGRLLVLVHGLCMNDLQWRREGHDHGAALADALGCTPLYLRYNSGLHVADNGAEFAQTLEKLVAAWPCPVAELIIVGHSMGGLVARSACHHGEAKQHAWLKLLRKMVFLGTPHHGSPLERGGHGLDYLMSLSPYSAPLTRLGRSRSAGIRDLRHGTLARGRHRPVPLPAHVECYAAGAMLGEHRGVVSERLVGDGLVPLDSALGLHKDPAHSLGIPKSHQWIGAQTGHLELLSRPEVYRQLEAWLRDGA
jgi:pimeloyl-ACP methyl ester carboxylesterase